MREKPERAMQNNAKATTTCRGWTCLLPLAACLPLLGACSHVENLTSSPGIKNAANSSVSALNTAMNATGTGLGVAADSVSTFLGGPSEATGKQQQAQPGKQKVEIVGVDSKVPQLLKAMGAGETIDVQSALSDEVQGWDDTLAYCERGRLAQLQSETDFSLEQLGEALDEIEEFDERAYISLSDMATHAASLVVNDNLIPYEPPPFERVLAYHYQALNYLMKGNLEDAGVEVRRANAAQVAALKAHEEELADAEEEARSRDFSTSPFSNKIDAMLGSTKAVAAQVKNSFQNAYTFYMSAVVHELMGEPNDAYIDYKKALEIAPKNSVIQRDVARLALDLDMTDDIEAFRKRFPGPFRAGKTPHTGRSEAVVLFEDGIIPGKTAVAFPLPIPIKSAPGLTMIAIPIYRASVAPVHPLSISQGEQPLGSTETICAMDALAVKAYRESIVPMIIRQIVRASIKGAASALASKHGGLLAGSAVAVYNVLTEVADTRSWRSLPQNAQVLRAYVSAGSKLNLVHAASGARGTVDIPAESGKKVVVRATRLGSRLFVQSISF